MVIRVKAIYEDGVIKPVEPLTGVADRETITVTVETSLSAPANTPEQIAEILRLARASDEGLTDEQRRIEDSARLKSLR